MDEFRYFLGLVLVLIMPVVIAFWLVIHLGANTWRMHNPNRAYLAAGIPITVVTGCAIYWREALVGADFGMSWVIFSIGFVVYLFSWRLWRPIKKQLDFRTFAGIPEVTNDPVPLITKGPFSVVRHPRYLMVMIGVVGWCLMSHHSGSYGMGLVSVAGLFLIVHFEEKELLERYGDTYREYQAAVPRIFPDLKGLKRLLFEKL